jgi:hypothetical protein
VQRNPHSHSSVEASTSYTNSLSLTVRTYQHPILWPYELSNSVIHFFIYYSTPTLMRPCRMIVAACHVSSSLHTRPFYMVFPRWEATLSYRGCLPYCCLCTPCLYLTSYLLRCGHKVASWPYELRTVNLIISRIVINSCLVLQFYVSSYGHVSQLWLYAELIFTAINYNLPNSIRIFLG